MRASRCNALLLCCAAGFALACDDDNSSCASWAKAGECEKNRAFMAGACALSCGHCTPPPPLTVKDDPRLGPERAVISTSYGEIVLGFFPSVAPVTVKHIVKLFQMGGYNTNEIFRVDKGFVAQIQGVEGGRRARMNKALAAEAAETVPDEFSDIPHERGVLSMGKFDEPHTGTSSFSMLLGAAPFLDGKYTVFGRVVSGDHVLAKLEKVETKREGIFVMPKERIELQSACIMYADEAGALFASLEEARASGSESASASPSGKAGAKAEGPLKSVPVADKGEL